MMKLNFKLITVIVMAGLSSSLMGRNLQMEGRYYLSYGDDMFGYYDIANRSLDEALEKNYIKREIIRRSRIDKDFHYSGLVEHATGWGLLYIDESDQLQLARRFEEFRKGFELQKSQQEAARVLENKKLAVEDIEKSIQHFKDAGNSGKAAALERELEKIKAADRGNVFVLFDFIKDKRVVVEVVIKSIRDKGFHYSRLVEHSDVAGLLDLDVSSGQPRLAQRFKDFQEGFELDERLEPLRNRTSLVKKIGPSINYFNQMRLPRQAAELEQELKAIGTPESEIDKIVQALTSKFTQHKEGIIAAL